MKTPKINDLSTKMNHLQVQKMASSQASELKVLAPRKKREAWLGELAKSCRARMIKFPCNLHINGVAASTSGNASRGNQDSWRRIVSLADGMEHIMLGKYLSKSRTKRCFWVRKLFWKFPSNRQIQPGENKASSGFWDFFGCFINYLQLTFKWEWIPQSPRETATMTKMNTWREQRSSDTPGLRHLLRTADNPQLHCNP